MMSNKVSNMNIFSGELSLEMMQKQTEEGFCVEEGDYLAWPDMKWELHGEATVETVEKEMVCKGEPSSNLFYAQFSKRDSCLHFCENLGSRVPSVATIEDWKEVEHFLKAELYDKRSSSTSIWLPIDDEEKEGEWRDSQTNQPLNYALPWAASQPDEGRGSNFAQIMTGGLLH